MHGVLITFTSEHDIADLEKPFHDLATALAAVPGLISKAWLADGTTLGGFHLFDSKAAADGYLESEIAAELRSTDGFTDFEVRHFDVIDRLSAMTGVAVSS